MEIVIKPDTKNRFPLEGMLVRGSSIQTWLLELEHLNLNLSEINVFPIPDITPNCIWGCFVLSSTGSALKIIGKNEACQKVSANVYIAENSYLFPPLNPEQMKSIFSKGLYVMHPHFGLVELTEPLNWTNHIAKLEVKTIYSTLPQKSVFIPKQVKQFQIKPISSEEILSKLEHDVFPKREKIEKESFSILERVKLGFYRLLFRKNKNTFSSNSSKSVKTLLMKDIEHFFSQFLSMETKWIDKMKEDFEDLEARNQKEIEKLLDLLKKNPSEALKYAIPLDESGVMRGKEQRSFNLSKVWSDFSLNNVSINSGSGVVTIGDHGTLLRNQYYATAQELMQQNDFQKAAFVYLKLLKDNHSAASALEQGEHYLEAASIYLKHCQNKSKAAECYEKGNSFVEAIDLYKQLNSHEKVGDLYSKLGKKEEARIFYDKVIQEYKTESKYVKAANVYLEKLNELDTFKTLLLEGWHTNKDSFSCLKTYIESIPESKERISEIQQLYSEGLSDHKSTLFLQLVKQQFMQKSEHKDELKEIAYEIIAQQLPTNPSIVGELKDFNKADKELAKDTIRFKLKNK